MKKDPRTVQSGVQFFESVTLDNHPAALHPSGLHWNPAIQRVEVRCTWKRVDSLSSMWRTRIRSNSQRQSTPTLHTILISKMDRSFGSSFKKENFVMLSLSHTRKHNRLADYSEKKCIGVSANKWLPGYVGATHGKNCCCRCRVVSHYCDCGCPEFQKVRSCCCVWSSIWSGRFWCWFCPISFCNGYFCSFSSFN